MADFSALQAATDMDPMVIGDQFDLQSVNAVEVIPEPEPIQPRMPGSIAGIRQSLDMPGEPEALMPGSVRARIDDLKLRLGMNVESAVQPRLPGSIEAQRNLFQYNMAEMMAQQTAESAVEMVEEPEGPPQGFLEQTIAGVRDIPEALLASGNDLVSLLVHVPAIVDAAVTGEYEGMFADWSRASFERSARIRSGMSPRDPNLSWMERVLNMQTLIPTVADFGLQMVASGGLGAAAKVAGTEAALKMGATAAGARFAGRAAAITAASTHAGVSEAVHTFDEMQRRGYTVGESLSAFSKHAVASGMLNAPTFAFLLGKLPSFTQQRMLAKMLEGGTVEAVTETLDEVAGHAAMGDFDVKSWQGMKEAAGYFWEVFPEIGPAAFLIGGGVGAIGRPPVKPSPVSAGELEARENIDYSTIEGTGIDSEVLPSYVAKVMEREATYAKLRSGEKIPLIDADNDRGGLVRYEFGWYLIPPGHKNGTAEPIPFNQIVEVGKHEVVNGVGSEVVLVGSEVMENVQKKGEEFRELLYGKDLVEVPKSKSRAEARKLLLDQMLKDRTELKTEGALIETEEEIAKKRLGKLEENKGYVWPGLFGGKMKPTAVVRERLEHYRQVLGDLEVIREQVRAIESDPGLKEALSAEAGLGILGAEKQAAEAQLEGLKARQAELEQMAFEAEDEMEVDAELAKEVMMELAGVEKRLDEITAAEEKLGSGFIYDENGIQFESVERFFTVQPEVGQNVVDGVGGENNQADVILSAMTQGNEDVRRDLIDGVIAVDDVVQGQFEAQGLLKFVEVDGKYRISRVEGQSDLEYQGALDEYVRSVRRLHTALYYSSEVVEERQKKIAQVAEKYPIRDGETMEEYIGRVGPRTGGPLFSKGEGVAEFLGWQERPGGKPPIALYNIPTADGGKTTVTAETARERGFIVPEPPQRGEVLESKAKGVKNQKTAAAFYAAALNHTTLYPTLLNAAVVAGHQDPFTSAKLGSEIAVSMARAWVQGGKGRSVQEFFDTYAREVRAFAEKVKAKDVPSLYRKYGLKRGEGLSSIAEEDQDLINQLNSTSSGHYILGRYYPGFGALDFFGGSDLPTFLHEFAHAWRQSMSGKELDALAKWAHGKKKPPADGSWTVEAEEKFADTFVSWASNTRSKAPVGLENAFKEIAQYTTELYKTHSYLNPGKKISPQFAEHMEALYTKRLLLSANADDQEEGRRRTKTKQEFTNKNGRKDLGDHIEEMGKILGMDKESITGVIDAEAEAARRLKTKSYEIELNNKLKAMEKGELPVVDLADIIILRDRALKIRVEFEQNFRKAYDKGPQAVKQMVEGMKKRNNMVQLENFLKVRGDAGRRLNLFSNRMSQVDFALTLDEAQFRMGSKALDVLYQMMKDPERAMEIADKHGGEVNVRLKDLYFQAFFSGLLSSPQTLAVNTIFTGLWSLNNFFVLRPLAGAIEKTMWSARNITGVGKVIDKFFYGGDIRKRDEYVAPLADAFSGLGRAVKYAGRDAFEIVKSGGEVHKMEQIKGMDIHARDITAWQNYTVTESGLIGRTVRRLFGEAGGRNARLKIQGAIHDTGVLLALPTTMMRSSDMFFKVLAAEEALARLVSAEARRIHPSNRRAQKDYFNTQMSNYRDLDNLPPNMKKQWMQEMQQIASYDTFMDLPGQVTRHLLAIREAQPVTKLVIPFLNTVVNLGKRGLELTPGIGLLAEWSYTMDPQFKRDTFGHRPSDILAKQIEGMLLVAMLFLGLDDDDLIGAPPSDPKRAQLQLEQGKIPYSMRIGDRYISFQNAAPFNVPMSIIADLRQYVLSNVDDFDNPDPEVQKKVNQDLMQAALAFVAFGLNNGFMQNYGEYVRARTVENKSAVLGRTVESALVPYSGFLRWIQRSANASQNPEGYFVPNRKDTFTQNALPLTHNVINKMFGMPETDIPRLTVWGEPYHFSENKWWELWWPVHYQSASNDPLDAEVARLGYYPGMPHETYEVNGKRYRFSPDIHQQYVLGAGQDSKEAARRVVNSKYWNDVSDERKVKLLSDAVSRARERHHRRAKAEQYKRGLIPVSRGILTQ